MSRINEKRAVDLVSELMAIPGKSCEESEIAAAVKKHLISIGIPKTAITHDAAHKKSPAGGVIGNLIVKLPGDTVARKRSRLMLSAHLDTVPICVGCEPQRKGRTIRSGNPATGLGPMIALAWRPS